MTSQADLSCSIIMTFLTTPGAMREFIYARNAAVKQLGTKKVLHILTLFLANILAKQEDQEDAGGTMRLHVFIKNQAKEILNQE